MNWILLAHAKKRKLRFAMTVGGMAIGVATLFALLALSAGIEHSLEREVRGMGAHILLLPEGCPYELTLALMQGADALEHIPEALLPTISETDNVSTAVPAVVGKARVNGQLTSILGSTDQILGLKTWEIASLDGAVVGSDVAEKLGLAVGAPLTLELYAREELEVLRVLERSSGRDDTFVFVPQDVAQRVLGLNEKVSAVLVQTADVTEVDRTQYTLGRMADIQAVPPSDVFDRLMGLFGSIKQTLILITAIAIVAGVLTTMNTMSMAVIERKKEIGMLRALGAMRLDVVRMFAWESLLLSLLAGALGIVLGYAATRLLPQTSGFGLEAAPRYSVVFIGVCAAVAVAVGVVSSLYPAVTAAQTQPIKTLREL
jgi:putative ABC transport system permease protein